MNGGRTPLATSADDTLLLLTNLLRTNCCTHRLGLVLFIMDLSYYIYALTSEYLSVVVVVTAVPLE